MSETNYPPLPWQQYPVFVLGSPRSGTSTIAYLLKDHFEYDGHAEGHVFDLLHKIIVQIRDHYVGVGAFERAPQRAAETSPWLGTMTAEALNKPALINGIKTLFMHEVAHLFGPRWFEKTPGPNAIRAARSLVAMYPHAKFIHLIREPIANIESRIRKFPTVPFQQHCDEWVQSAEAWLQVKSYLPQHAYLELFTHDLDRNPRAVFDQIAHLLRDHPRPASVAAKPPLEKFPTIERTAPHDPAATRALQDTTWTDDQKNLFLTICGNILPSFGFSIGPQPAAISANTLPPPYGQSDVETSFGHQGGIWPQAHHGSIWIFLHPSSTPTKKTTLTYRRLTLAGVAKLTSRIAVIAPPPAPTVLFTLAIYTEDTPTLLTSAQFDCAPGQEKEITMPLPPITQKCRLTITTESTTGTVDNAWSLLLPLTFSPR